MRTVTNGKKAGTTNAQPQMDHSSMEIENIEITRPNEKPAAVSKGQQVVERKGEIEAKKRNGGIEHHDSWRAKVSYFFGV